MIRHFNKKDYEEVYQLWRNTPGVGLRSIDDSREGIERFLRRNPTTSFVAVEDNRIVGIALSGHDGRRGYLYHICVEKAYRRRCIGRQLIEYVTEAMKAENITKLGLICFAQNEAGNRFWRNIGWQHRTDLNYYNISINDKNK